MLTCVCDVALAMIIFVLLKPVNRNLALLASAITIGDRSYTVRRTSRSKLREVDFEFENHRLRGLEQNPNTSSRWAQSAREGRKVMQFLEAGRYIANVVDGNVQRYGRPRLLRTAKL